jgi:hypothetical protein
MPFSAMPYPTDVGRPMTSEETSPTQRWEGHRPCRRQLSRRPPFYLGQYFEEAVYAGDSDIVETVRPGSEKFYYAGGLLGDRDIRAPGRDRQNDGSVFLSSRTM